MASAVLSSRNDHHWGESRVYMRKYSSSNNTHLSHFNRNPNKKNPILNPNPSSVRQIHDPSTRPHVHQQSPRTDPPPVANNTQKESFHNGYVTFHLGAYSKGEVKELKKRLISELEHVRSLKNIFESRTAPHFNRSPPQSFGSKLGPGILLEIGGSRGEPSEPNRDKRPLRSGVHRRANFLGPGVRAFLKETSSMFELYIFTKACRPYALEMANLLDPEGVYFDPTRMFSREHCDQEALKHLDWVPGR
ncbi:hypothetical protein RJ640_020588 [Escallonia rubra]|uniref:protein-serine/threonine phosphatase n=1 Tax=Escallonia rubra TaxID=112253 RepID=A0AA88UMB8_9ASTE|nr:hypothetical protein RJ640_020588 [Escallonia rubra]